MTPLLIDETVKARIQEVRAYAEKNKLNRAMMERIVAGEEPFVGEDPGFECSIPFGFRVVFSIEEHPCGWCHHFSMSVETPGRVPNINAVRLLMMEFGISRPLEECLVEMENCIPPAVNVIAPISALQEVGK